MHVDRDASRRQPLDIGQDSLGLLRVVGRPLQVGRNAAGESRHAGAPWLSRAGAEHDQRSLQAELPDLVGAQPAVVVTGRRDRTVVTGPSVTRSTDR